MTETRRGTVEKKRSKTKKTMMTMTRKRRRKKRRREEKMWKPTFSDRDQESRDGQCR